jgi:LemA protein
MTTTIILLIILAVIVLWFVSTYNRFVTLKTQIEASIQEIGNQLKRQADLIPNLIASVKGFMKHEKEFIDSITDARKMALKVIEENGADAADLVKASRQMDRVLAPVRALFESTPQLQSAAPTQKLMEELRDTSDKIMYARRTLIDVTQNYNQMTVTIPSNIIASIFKFAKQPGLTTPESGEHLEVSTAETKTPKVEL